MTNEVGKEARARLMAGVPSVEGASLDECIEREHRRMEEEALISCSLAIVQLTHALASPLVGASARISIMAARHEALRCAKALEAVCAHSGAVPLSDAWHELVLPEISRAYGRPTQDAPDATHQPRAGLFERLRAWWQARRDRRHTPEEPGEDDGLTDEFAWFWKDVPK